MSEDSTTQALAAKEYEGLRKEIADTVTETRTLERNAVLASAAVWTWLLVQPTNVPWIGAIKFIPFVLCLFAAVRSAALYRDIMQHADYIRKIEQRWGDAKVFYWETQLLPQGRYLGATAVMIWLLLVFGNLALAWCLNESWFTPVLRK